MQVLSEKSEDPCQSYSTCETSFEDDDSDFGEEEASEDGSDASGDVDEPIGDADDDAGSDGGAGEVKADEEPSPSATPTEDHDTEMNIEDPNPFKEQKAVDILVTGAATRTWEALLFYLHTGFVEFAPLSSHGDQRSSFLRDFKLRSVRQCPPCSCKSLYRLACQFDLEALQECCLQHLQWQLNAKVVIEEVFTEFASKHTKVRNLLIKYLVDSPGELVNSLAFQAKLGEVTNGNYPNAGKTVAEIFQRVTAKRVNRTAT